MVRTDAYSQRLSNSGAIGELLQEEHRLCEHHVQVRGQRRPHALERAALRRRERRGGTANDASTATRTAEQTVQVTQQVVHLPGATAQLQKDRVQQQLRCLRHATALHQMVHHIPQRAHVHGQVATVVGLEEKIKNKKIAFTRSQYSLSMSS